MTISRRSGFTLLEVVVALGVTGAVTLVAHAALVVSLQQTAVLKRLIADHDRERNSWQLLRRLAADVDIRVGETALRGDTVAAVWRSWCDVPEGWQEPCAVRLRLRGPGGVHHPVLAVPYHGDVPLRLDAPARLGYLSEASSGGRWLATWSDHIGVPLAIGIFAPHDTMIIRIGGPDQ